MQNCKERILSVMNCRFVEIGYSPKDVKKIIDVISLELNNYDVQETCTDIVLRESESEQLLKLYRGTLLTEGRSVKTVYGYLRLITRFKESVQKPLVEVNSFDVRVWLAKMQQQVSLHTCENYRLYLSSFYTWLVNEEIIEKNPVSKIKPVKYLESDKKSFSETEIDAIRSSCKDIRKRAEVELLLSSGVRVEELTNLDISDINFTTFEVHVRNGKGKKARTTYMSEVCALYLKKYLDTRNDSYESLFISNMKQRISRGSIRRDLSNLGIKSNVDNVHPHRFRRTFATNMHHRGMDIRTIQILMGHSNINTTTKYIANDTERIKVEYKRHM